MPLVMQDAPGDTIVELETDGATFKPFLNCLRVVLDEAKVRFEPEGIHVSGVDPANVMAIEVTLFADALDSYSVTGDGTMVGASLSSLRHIVRRARMGHDDTLSLRVAERRLYATVDREYDDADVVTEDRMDLIDPGAIRQEPDLPDLDLVDLSVGMDAFRDVTEHAEATADYINYHVENGDLRAAVEADELDTAARVADVAPEGVEAHCFMSASFMLDMLAVHKKAKADDVTVRMGDELPMEMLFSREHNDTTAIEGSVFLAPGVRDD